MKVNNAHKSIIFRSIKDIADTANDLITKFNDASSQLAKHHELTLKNRDGSPFLGSFRNLYEFNKNILGNKYARVGDLKVAA